MRLYLVNTFTSSARINDLHYRLFHGLARKRGEKLPSFPAHTIDEDLSDLMLLTRNGWRVPPVFKPTTSTSLVISANVRRLLGDLPNVVYLPVVFEKLVEYPFTPGDFSYFDTNEYQGDPIANDHATLLTRLPDVPRLHAEIGDFYELVIGNYHRVMSLFSDRTIVHFHYPYLGGQKSATLDLSIGMVSEYPILWSEHGTIFTEREFARVSEFFDPDYFVTTEIAIG